MTHNILRVGQPVPSVSGKMVTPENTIVDFSLDDSKERNGVTHTVFFFYPLAFTFVCPTELVALGRHFTEFESRNIRLIAISVDSPHALLQWKKIPVNKGGIGDVPYGLLSDQTHAISQKYGVLTEEGVALRATFVFDKKQILQHFSINNLSIGRSVGEVLRVVDALQHHEKYGEVCPAGWNKGDDAMLPTSEGVADYLTSHEDDL